MDPFIRTTARSRLSGRLASCFLSFDRLVIVTALPGARLLPHHAPQVLVLVGGDQVHARPQGRLPALYRGVQRSKL